MDYSRKRQKESTTRSRCRRLHEGVICLLVLMVQFPGTVPGVREIMQPTFAVGIIGKAISFSCQLRYDEGSVSRIHLYVYILDASNKKEILHPSDKDSYKKRLSISDNGNQTHKSVQISDLHFNDTNKYYCMMSIVEDKMSHTVTGNGTLLFVHGPLKVKKQKNSTVVCEVQVRMVEGVEIVWTDGDTEMSAENFTVETAEHDTYRIIRQLMDPGLTTNIFCLLRHKSRGHISKQSMNISGRLFAQKQTPEEPLVLYVVTLVNRLLLLIIVLVAFKLNDRSLQRRL